MEAAEQQEDDYEDFWSKRLNIECGGYNSAIDRQIYSVAKLICDARKNDTSIFCNDIAEKLNMTPEHVELIQYILGSVHYPPNEGKDWWDREPFTYGTSPRGLFTAGASDKFMAEFEGYLKLWDKNEDN